MLLSTGLTDEACTRTSTSFGAGVGAKQIGERGRRVERRDRYGFHYDSLVAIRSVEEIINTNQRFWKIQYRRNGLSTDEAAARSPQGAS
jgi:hypothetical protein